MADSKNLAPVFIVPETDNLVFSDKGKGGKLQWIDPALCDRHPRNPRDPIAFDRSTDDAFGRLIDGMELNGFIPGNYVVVMALPNGRYLILKGHRRIAAALQTTSVKLVEASILKPMDEASQLAIIYDHDGVKGLTDPERLTTVRNLVELGYGRPRIAAIVGLKYGKTQELMRILELPPTDQVIWKAYQNYGKDAKIDGKPLPYVPKTTTMRALHSAIVADRVAIHARVPVSERPGYKAAIVKAKAPDTGLPDAFDRSGIEGLGDVETSCPLLALLFHRLSGKNKEDLPKLLMEIRSHLPGPILTVDHTSGGEIVTVHTNPMMDLPVEPSTDEPPDDVQPKILPVTRKKMKV